MVKQCCYCFQVEAEDGEYHNVGLTGPISALWVRNNPAQPKEGVPVSHGVCAACFEAQMGFRPEEMATEEASQAV